MRQPDLGPAIGMLSGETSNVPRTQPDTTFSPNGRAAPSHIQTHPRPPPTPTTLYTFPPRSTTFQNPLTPEELAFLQRNPSLFAHTAPQLASNMISNGMASPAPPSPWTAMTTHSCGCGDACNCLGCIAHPYNLRTMSFVQSLQDLMATDNLYELPDSHRLSLPGPVLPNLSAAYTPVNPAWPNSPPMAVNGHQHESNWLPVQSPMQHNLNGAGSCGHLLPLANTDYGCALLSGVSSMDPPQQHFAGSLDLQGQQVVSSTDFFHVNYPISSGHGGDVDCPCGEGCTCSGCLTHRNHNQAPAIPPVPQQTVPNVGLMHCSGQSGCKHLASLQPATVDDGPFHVS